jgi:ABC-2 type transport system permease protein
VASPIADLSYRNYDGPLEPPMYRWWAIAKATMQPPLKNKWFWGLAIGSGYWYLLLMAIFYFTEMSMQNLPLGQKNPFFERLIWKDQFLNGFSIAQFGLFLLALLIGVGTIANDNRANALLVYLSKPVSRLDYLIGKWLGIFIPLAIITAVPTFFFFSYCFMSYRDYGFLSEDPRLFWKLLLLVLLPGAFHASVALGISSLFDQGRLAGATYAGMFFMTLFFTKAMQIAFLSMSSDGQTPPAIVKTLYYASVDGILIGLGKIVLGTDGSNLIPGMPSGMGRNPMTTAIPAPSAALFVGLYLGICAIALLLAWSRIRAVEVVA